MRLLSLITGLLLAVTGIFAIANSGLTFISVAFILGIILVIVGLVECFSYKGTRTNDEGKHWLLIEGLTTFVLGIVVLTGQLAADVAVPVVFGMWIMISGIRALVLVFKAFENNGNRDRNFYWELAVGGLNTIAGIYTFFNSALFHMPVLMMLGICFVLQAANLLKIAFGISVERPDFIKSKDEIVAEATVAAEKAHEEAKAAIKAAKEAKAAVKEAESKEEFDEIVNKPVDVE